MKLDGEPVENPAECLGELLSELDEETLSQIRKEYERLRTGFS